jgi:hypothetical protein
LVTFGYIFHDAEAKLNRASLGKCFITPFMRDIILFFSQLVVLLLETVAVLAVLPGKLLSNKYLLVA